MNFGLILFQGKRVANLLRPLPLIPAEGILPQANPDDKKIMKMEICTPVFVGFLAGFITAWIVG
jgi:hypothetical protein